MRPGDVRRAAQISTGLTRYARDIRALPGISTDSRRNSLVEQIVESIRRVEFVRGMTARDLSESRADPLSDAFDPLKAALIRCRNGRIDDAFWLVFLAIHFGKNRRGGWRYAREVYGALDGVAPWNWERVSRDVQGFREWLDANQGHLRRPGAGFGNHRKYESLKAWSLRGTGAVVSDYVDWVHPPRTHSTMIAEARATNNGDRKAVFEHLYRTLSVVSFGRMAKFDLLTMFGKLGLADIEPGSPFLHGATGPLRGARLLFGGSKDADLDEDDLDAELVRFGAEIGLGMQEVEDSLCNWQKSPGRFKPFRG